MYVSKEIYPSIYQIVRYSNIGLKSKFSFVLITLVKWFQRVDVVSKLLC